MNENDQNDYTEATTDSTRKLRRYKHLLWMRCQKMMDEITPHVHWRWIGTSILLLLFIIRILSLGGFYIVAYALGIFLLNQFIGFISPQVDPETDDSLPTSMSVDDDFRPFIRHLPEKRFWIGATRATLLSIFATFIPFLDIPVFWPILVIYFFALLFVTLKNQIKHMIKHRYLPWNYGKKTYTSKRPL